MPDANRLDSDQPAQPLSLITQYVDLSVSLANNEDLPVRLRGCPGWFGFLLVAHSTKHLYSRYGWKMHEPRQTKSWLPLCVQHRPRLGVREGSVWSYQILLNALILCRSRLACEFNHTWTSLIKISLFSPWCGSQKIKTYVHVNDERKKAITVQQYDLEKW